MLKEKIIEMIDLLNMEGECPVEWVEAMLRNLPKLKNKKGFF